MVLTLYTFPTATTRKVHITLEELGLKYNLKKVEVYQGKHYGEEFLKINPFRKVPVIVDDTGEAKTISDTGAILLYLTATYDTDYTISYPYASTDYWQLVRMLFYVITSFQSTHMGVNYFTYVAKKKNPDAVETLTGEELQAFGLIEKHLKAQKTAHLESDGPWLAGGKYTVADIALYSYFENLMPLGIELSKHDHPELYNWAGRVSTRDAVVGGLKVAA